MSAELLLTMPLSGEAGEQTHTEAQRIRRFTGRMNRLIGDLLDVVSMESSTRKLFAKPQDATGLLTETMESFYLLAQGRKLQMTSAVTGRPAPANFDYERILQVLANLVGNSMKFTEAGGKIALHLAPTADGIWFTVRDSGCGIAPENIDAIFARFAQAARADRRGLGLGLYIARCIVEAHGGKIWVESKPGQGSAFHFILPTKRADGIRPGAG